MNNLIAFLKDSWAELKQVAWLTVPQMVASTWLVVVLVIIMAIYLAGVDFVIKFFMGFLI